MSDPHRRLDDAQQDPDLLRKVLDFRMDESLARPVDVRASQLNARAFAGLDALPRPGLLELTSTPARASRWPGPGRCR